MRAGPVNGGSLSAANYLILRKNGPQAGIGKLKRSLKNTKSIMATDQYR